MSQWQARGLLALLVTAGLLACAAPTAPPAASADAANGVTIDNGSDATVRIVYEAPDGGTEQLAELAPAEQIVIDAIFAGRDGLCRTGRLVALAEAGTELDELYLVCRGRSWTVTIP